MQRRADIAGAAQTFQSGDEVKFVSLRGGEVDEAI